MTKLTPMPATEATKTALENSVNWFLADKLQQAATIVTKKYLTDDNELVYLTLCSIAETAVPRVKIQIFERVDGGVREVGYQLFGDHRFEKYINEMIFGTQPGISAGEQSATVSETEAGELIKQVNALNQARQIL